MFKKLFKMLTSNVELKEFDEKIHKECEECWGGGIDPVAGRCFECGGNGFIDKTSEDKIEEALNYRK